MTERRIKTNSWAWVRVRKKVLRRDNYLCQVCRKAVANQVDHIIPTYRLKTAREELELINLQAICQPCHGQKTTREQSGGRDLTDLVDAYYV